MGAWHRRIWKEYFEDLYNVDVDIQTGGSPHIYVSLIGFREVTTSEENLLVELRLR